MLYNFPALHDSEHSAKGGSEYLMGQLFSAPRNVASYALLETGQTAYVCVYANRLWNDSGIDVISGQNYRFSVPEGERWAHWRRTCTADGCQSRWLIRPWERFRRVPKAKWLQLIATIGRSAGPAIVIGSGLIDFFPPFPGRLYFFANALPWMRWHSSGMIAVRVTRTK